MLARLHLAMFYFYGFYYVWPKRVTGAHPSDLQESLWRRDFRVCPLCISREECVAACCSAGQLFFQHAVM